MRIFFKWICILILPHLLIHCQPLHNRGDHDLTDGDANRSNYNAQNIPKVENVPTQQEQIISVRITSSVAVGRGRAKSSHKILDNYEINTNNSTTAATLASDPNESIYTTSTPDSSTTLLTEEYETITEIPPNLVGANIEYIKQLQAKKETRGVNNFEQIHSFQINAKQVTINDTQYTITDSTIPTTSETDNGNYETTENVPIARSIPLSYSSKNYIADVVHKALDEHHGPRLTTVSFNVLHDEPQRSYNEPSNNGYNEPNNNGYNEPGNNGYINPSPSLFQQPTYTNNAPQVYSEPSKIYSEPAKFYSEPAKVYSEPSKIYSEPAKVYSEPAKIYSEPAKFYSQPASLHLAPETLPSQRPWGRHTEIPNVSSSTLVSTTPLTTMTNPSFMGNTRIILQQQQQPEKNYEVDEKVSVMTEGRTHGVQPQQSDPENCKQEKCKVGYVVEGRQYRKYRVEERTSDGFIVGEYGVVRNEDGALRGVRYTADSEASPRLIHDALMKFLQLK